MPVDIEVNDTRPIIEIIIEESYAESAKKYFELIKEYYHHSGPNPFLVLKLIDKGSNNGIPNVGPGLELGDVVRGFFNKDTYWPAAYYLGGDITLRSSWKPFWEGISTPVFPDIPNPNPPVDPPAPDARNYSDNFSSTHYKIFSS